MKFGVFDHLDRNSLELAQQFRDRLKLVEAYDRAGFYAYHLAEHHGTPLGIGSAPSVFLAAVSERTETLRFGPMVYTLSIYHPLRAIEEICMLDQLSSGRLEVGVGRGVSPIEMGFYGVGEDSREKYEEVISIVLQGLVSGRLNYSGKYFSFEDVPLELKPYQRPYPPLWYGVAQPDRVTSAVAKKMNIITNGLVTAVRMTTDRFKAEWAESKFSREPFPFIGMSRHIVIAETEKEAIKWAAPAYEKWWASLLHLWRIHNIEIPVNFPETFDQAKSEGHCIVGTAPAVRELLEQQIEEAGVNYLLCRLAFGDLPLSVSMQSVAFMQSEVMPAFSI